MAAPKNLDLDVDELMRMPIPGTRPGINAPPSKEMTTGVYSVQFFEGHDQMPQVPALKHLDDAAACLQAFIEETTKALEVDTAELTPDQRIHIATIATFVEGLGDRFDRIRVPGYTQKNARR